MLPIAVLLMATEASQEVRVIYPDPAEVAAARLPVPAIVLTRAEADAMSDAALAERLIGHVAHTPIVRVERQRPDPSPIWPGANALKWVTFVERGRPLRGRLCESRSIAVTFDTVDGKDEPRTLSTPAATRPRRVFAVTQNRLIGVAASKATPGSCARAAFAGAGRVTFDAMAGVVERLVAVAGGGDGGLALDSCFDRFAAGSTRCDPRATLRGLDWSQLRTISRTGFTGEPVRWAIRVGPDERSWDIAVEETRATPRVALKRDYPPPF